MTDEKNIQDPEVSLYGIDEEEIKAMALENLKRNRIGIEMQNFPELVAARRLAWQLASGEQNSMPVYKNDLWAEESERLYKHLQQRCGVFRRKVDRTEGRMGKTDTGQ